MTTTLTTTATSSRRASSSTFALGGFDPITSWDALRAPAAVREATTQTLVAPDRDPVD